MPNEAFFKFLQDNPEMLKYMASIVKEWIKVHGEMPVKVPPGRGPRKWSVGEKHELVTVGISNTDLDNIIEASAEAVVIEKFVEYCKGFISGVVFKMG